jgi:hypothetical protein
MESYYDFLESIGEKELQIVSEKERSLINKIERLLPLVRVDEYLIIRDILHNGKLNIDRVVGYNLRVTKESLMTTRKYLEEQNIISDNRLIIENYSKIENYLTNLIEYGIRRYDNDFGEFEGKYKLYGNYSKEQTMTSIGKTYSMDIKLKGTYFDQLNGDTYIYVGLKKDKTKQERTNYKDKFLSSSVFQWESENNTTTDSTIGRRLANTKNVHLFVRKMDDEDNIVLPFTYFGTGKLTNQRVSQVTDQKTGAKFKTLLYDIQLDNVVPDDYLLDFEIPYN